MTKTPYSFEATRRTGPIDHGERLALAKLFATYPRPLISIHVIAGAPKHRFSKLIFGFTELEQRGWVRVRCRSGSPRWDLTARIMNELPDFSDPSARNALVAEVEQAIAKEDAEIAAGIAAAAASAPPVEVQRGRMGLCVAFVGWLAHHGEDDVGGLRESRMTLFNELLELVEVHGPGYPGAEEIRAAAVANDELSIEMVDRARDACEGVPLDAFKAALRRLGNENWLTHPEDTLQ